MQYNQLKYLFPAQITYCNIKREAVLHFFLGYIGKVDMNNQLVLYMYTVKHRGKILC